MFNNYFFLCRAVLELNSLFKGGIIYDSFSQEKNTLFLHIPSELYPDRHLVFNLNNNQPLITVKKTHKKAKKNTFSFFSDNLPSKIEHFEIALRDRIINIRLFNGIISVILRGPKSNLIFNDSDNLSFFKKNLFSIEELDEMFEKTEFFIPSDNFSAIHNFFTADENMDEFINNFPAVKKIISDQNIIYNHDDPVNFKELVNLKINSFLRDKISICKNLNNSISFLPGTFTSAGKVVSESSSYLESVEELIKTKSLNNAVIRIQKKISDFLSKEEKYISNTRDKLLSRIEKGNLCDFYTHCANLLMINLYNIPTDQKIVNLVDHDNKNISIKYNPELTPQENSAYYYKKSKEEKINFEKSIELLKNVDIYTSKISDIRNRFTLCKTLEELRKIESELFTDKKTEKKLKDDRFNARHYILNSQYHIYVGKDSKSNDYLSLKFANQNDYWFHVRGMPGSHVVLRNDNTKEIIPKNIIKEVAGIAAFYSKAKTAGIVPVTYTLAKFVYKKKGMDPGQVCLTKEQVILVKPGIPTDALSENE